MMNAKVLATWHAEQRDALADAIKRFDSGELDNGIMFSIRAEQHDFHKRAVELIEKLSKPLSDKAIFIAVYGVDNFDSSLLKIARAIERAHGIISDGQGN